MYVFNCPACKRVYPFSPDLDGKRIQCECGYKFDFVLALVYESEQTEKIDDKKEKENLSRDLVSDIAQYAQKKQNKEKKSEEEEKFTNAICPNCGNTVPAFKPLPDLEMICNCCGYKFTLSGKEFPQENEKSWTEAIVFPVLALIGLAGTFFISYKLYPSGKNNAASDGFWQAWWAITTFLAFAVAFAMFKLNYLGECFGKCDKKTRDQISGCGCFIFLVIGLALFFSTCDYSENSLSNMQIDGKPAIGIEGTYYAEEFVKRELLAPSTAEFCPTRDYLITDLGDETFLISGYVDSQNGFGAQIRTNFSITLKYDGKNKKWIKIGEILFK